MMQTKQLGARMDRRNGALALRTAIIGSGYWFRQAYLKAFVAFREERNAQGLPQLFEVPVVVGEMEKPTDFPEGMSYRTWQQAEGCGERFDVVLCAVPHTQHYSVVQELLLRRLLVQDRPAAIVLQKPIASNLSQAQRMAPLLRDHAPAATLLVGDHYVPRLLTARNSDPFSAEEMRFVDCVVWETKMVAEIELEAHGSAEGICNWLVIHPIDALVKLIGPIQRFQFIGSPKFGFYKGSEKLLGKIPTACSFTALVETDGAAFTLRLDAAKGAATDRKEIAIYGRDSNLSWCKTFKMAGSDSRRVAETKMLLTAIAAGKGHELALTADEAVSAMELCHQAFGLWQASQSAPALAAGRKNRHA